MGSSPMLAKKMVRDMGLERARAVAEFGPGTGAFTGAIMKTITPGCTFFAIEKHPPMAAVLRQRFPSLHLHEADALDVKAICAKEGVEKLDAVLSGLPFIMFPDELQERILDETVAVMRPGAKFATFTYRVDGQGKARAFRKRLERYFPEVRVTGLTILNLPPACIFRCTL